MGGKSSSEQQQTQQSVSQPWAPAQGLLGGILGQLQGGLGNTGLTGTENNALQGLLGNSGALGQFVSGLQGTANQFVGGGPDRTGMLQDAYQNYQNQLAPTAGGQYLNPATNPWFSQVTNTIGNDVQNRINAQYAGAGRDPAGAGSYGQTLGRGIAEGTAPIFANAYAQERGNQLGAQQGLFGAAAQGSGLLSQLDAQRLGLAQQGAGLAQTAQGFQNDPFNQQLAIEAMRRGIPLQNLQAIAGLGIPIAGLGGQTNATGTSTGSQTMSGAQQFGTIAGGMKNLGFKLFPGG